jgi:hypothetical protein
VKQRYEREIEDILGRGGDDLPGGPSRPPRRQRPLRPPGGGWRLSPGWMLALGLGLLVVAGVCSLFIPVLTQPLGWAGIALLVTGYFLSFRRRRGPGTGPGGYQKRWRGEVIDFPSPGRRSGWRRLWPF